MSITTYTELLAAMTKWGLRPDQATLYPDFVALFEAEANRRIRVRQMEASASITMTAGAGTLPTDYLVWKQVVWPGSPRRILEYADWSSLELMFPTQPAAPPSNFAILGSTISVMPIDDTALSLRYFQKIPSLISSATNWLLSAHPDAYLWGSLGELFSKVRDVEKAAMCLQKRDAIFEQIVSLSQKSKAPSQIRLHGAWSA